METWPPEDADVRSDLAKLGWTIAFATATLLGAHLWNPLNLDLEALVPRASSWGCTCGRRSS